MNATRSYSDAELRRMIADNVTAEIARKRVSRPELARVLGLSVSTMNFRLSGRRSFTFEEIVKICQHLEISPIAITPDRREAGAA